MGSTHDPIAGPLQPRGSPSDRPTPAPNVGTADVGRAVFEDHGRFDQNVGHDLVTGRWTSCATTCVSIVFSRLETKEPCAGSLSDGARWRSDPQP